LLAGDDEFIDRAAAAVIAGHVPAVALEDQRGFIAMAGQDMAVDFIEGGVGQSALKPAPVRRVVGVERMIPRLKAAGRSSVTGAPVLASQPCPGVSLIVKERPNAVLSPETAASRSGRNQQICRLASGRARVDGYDMALFPRSDTSPGASGALALGDVYKPSKDGAILYFDVSDIDAVLARATDHGAKTLYEKKDIGDAGFVADFEDSEGNRIALTQAPG
jgi:predicted enzyme related to lactoylglutathione lyase